MLPQYSNFDASYQPNVHPVSSDKRSRSRSKSRSRDHKRRKHKRYHRSRSGSRDDRSSRVHVNPLFSGSLGPSASALLQTNERLELEVQRLRQESSCVLARINPLENELRNSVTLRQRLEQQMNNEISMKNKLQLQNQELLKKVSNLERQISESYRTRNELEESKRKCTELERNFTVQTQNLTDQNNFYRDRNQTLTSKCEELLERCRTAQLTQEAAENQVQVARRDVDVLRERIETQNLDFKRVQGYLGAAREKETVWIAERTELEKKLNIQKSLLNKGEKQNNKDREEIDKLKSTLRSAHPAMDAQLGLESLFRAFEVMKEHCTGQLKDMRDRVDPLADSCKQCFAVSDDNLSIRPIRVSSAPPALDLLDVSCIPGSSAAKSVFIPPVNIHEDTVAALAHSSCDVKSHCQLVEQAHVDALDETLLELDSGELAGSSMDLLDEAELLGL